MTVTLYGLSAEPVAAWLRVTRPSITRPLLVGGEPWVVDLGRALRDSGLSVLMWTESEPQRERIRAAGLELAPDTLISDATGEGAQVEGVTTVLLLTSEDGFNALAAGLIQGGDGGRVYRVGSTLDARGRAVAYAGGAVLFHRSLTREALVGRYHDGARIAVGDRLAEGQDLLFRVRVNGRLDPVTTAAVPAARPGDRLVVLGPGHARDDAQAADDDATTRAP